MDDSATEQVDTAEQSSASDKPTTSEIDAINQNNNNEKVTEKLQKTLKKDEPKNQNDEINKASEHQNDTTTNAEDDDNNLPVKTETAQTPTSDKNSPQYDLDIKMKDSLTTTPPAGPGDVSPIIQTTVASATPVNLLSPPKSETQTDETNTVSTSASPASNSQLSPIIETEINTINDTKDDNPKTTASESQQAINVIANGTIPKSSGKPLMSDMNKKLNKTTRTRTRKPKTRVAMYESEISDHKVGIKLCIKKSDTATITNTNNALKIPTVTKQTTTTAAPTSKSNRKRTRKPKPRQESDDSEYESKRKKETQSKSNGERQKKVSICVSDEPKREAVEQTIWGEKLPEEILYKIFHMATEAEGCLPTLCRLGSVCTLWRRVSLEPSLWRYMDLSSHTREKNRTELKLKWFIENRCSSCKELNVSNWKISDINCVLGKIVKTCTKLEGITLAGWKNLTSDQLAYLVDNLTKLQRLDISSINVEMNANKTAVGLQSLCTALQKMGNNLTHLYLAHNRLAGIPQIVIILAKHCPNLVLLDLSNVTTQATSHGILHIEKLQHGCTKLKVLRLSNSHVTLSTATLQEMMDSPGFPDLEELSVAVSTDESRLVGDEHVQRILKTSSKLKLLDVRNCTRLTHESLIRLPAWDIKHLFLSGCSVTRDMGSGLELIASKWAHSLIELDLAWANVQKPLDNALRALAEKGSESPLAHLNLCGSSVSEEAVKDILANCCNMSSINLASCRGLPRGVKRLMQGVQELTELRDVLKVQMKVKLPPQFKIEKEEAAADDGSGSSKNN